MTKTTTIAKSKHITNEQRKSLYRNLLLCRRFEERVYYLFLEGRMPGTIHQATGAGSLRRGGMQRFAERGYRDQHASSASACGSARPVGQ